MDKIYQLYKEAAANSVNTLNDDIKLDNIGDATSQVFMRRETELTYDEKQYLLSVERGDVASTRLFLNGQKSTVNINCVDPLGRTALLIAIENENVELIELLLSYNIETGDAVLHAINEENVEAVEVILNHLDSKKGDENLQKIAASSSFTPDITPIILAAHRDNYEIIKLLLDRGNTIPKPHDVRCSCRSCVSQTGEDILRHSRSRINAYRALASPSLVCLSSKDPILTAFELCCELKRLSRLENEFNTDYEELASKCQDFAVALLDQTRGSKELETILNHDSDFSSADSGGQLKLCRLKLAIKYKQKRFVTHPNCQQLLGSLWYEGLPGFRRKSFLWKTFMTFTIGLIYPVLSLIYLVAPTCSIGRLLKAPFIKFICHSASYVTFLVLLILVSQRVDIVLLILGNTQNTGAEKRELRGASPTSVEWMILAYVAGLIWAEIKQLWIAGAKEYIEDMWNILDFITNSLYLATLSLRVIAYFQVEQEKQNNNPYAYYERRDWDAYDPTLISEVIFAAANIFSSLKLIHIFIVNSHLGPLQISLGRIVIDFLKFMFVFILVLFSVACGLNHLYWYYSNERLKECNKGVRESCHRKYRSFANLFEILQTLYWAIFGLIDLDHANLYEPDEVKFENKNPHQFTEVAGKLFFGSYSFVTIVVLLNMLIAMMSNSYQIIYSRADEEWKFARSKLWISYFDDGGTLSAPFNIIPSPKSLIHLLVWFKTKLCACSKKQKRSHWQSIRKLFKKINEKELRYQAVMRDLVKRYIVHKQRNLGHSEGVTEDDMNEIKQDISSLRYELLEIFRKNGMEMPNITQQPLTNMKNSRKKGSRINLNNLTRSLSSKEIYSSSPQSSNPSSICLTHSQSSLSPQQERHDQDMLKDINNFKQSVKSFVPCTIKEESPNKVEYALYDRVISKRNFGQRQKSAPESIGGHSTAEPLKEPRNRFKFDEGLGESLDQPLEVSVESSSQLQELHGASSSAIHARFEYPNNPDTILSRDVVVSDVTAGPPVMSQIQSEKETDEDVLVVEIGRERTI